MEAMCSKCHKIYEERKEEIFCLIGEVDMICYGCANKYYSETSKREELNNELDKFKPKSLDPKDGYFPPPWNPNDFPEKTLGWLEFQTAIKEDPKYYLGCGPLNSTDT